MATPRVFVSHSHEDDAFCRALVYALRQTGADVWYDEHNLGSGQLMAVIQRELGTRPIFIVILSKAAFASRWVKRETTWAFELYDRDASRILLPVTAAGIDRTDFSAENEWLFLHDFKRIEAPGLQPFPHNEAVWHTLRALGLTPAGASPAPNAPQPHETAHDLLVRGKVLNAQGKYADALAVVERATNLEPQNVEAWLNLGYTLDALERWQEALVVYTRATSLSPRSAEAWYSKGKALEALERFDEAVLAYDIAVALRHDYVRAFGEY
jgi:tetratricopeptide (TPR) repeat protein